MMHRVSKNCANLFLSKLYEFMMYEIQQTTEWLMIECYESNQFVESFIALLLYSTGAYFVVKTTQNVRSVLAFYKDGFSLKFHIIFFS